MVLPGIVCNSTCCGDIIDVTASNFVIGLFQDVFTSDSGVNNRKKTRTCI